MPSRLTPTTDLCIGFFLDAWQQGALHWPLEARILEIGCAEANWVETIRQIRPDIDLTAIDYRHCVRKGVNRLIMGDVLTAPFKLACFDGIVAISTIEHIGLHYYGDPTDADGDSKTIAKCAEWLKPGGELYFDVPYRHQDYEVHAGFRAYNDAAWESRLRHPAFVETWSYFPKTSHGDGPFKAVVYQKQ